MTDLPTITVVTPSFNAAATIDETLRSVREQDYPHVEHVVVDGGSTDGTVDILDRAEGVCYVSEPDRGLSHAMNKGVAMASGSIVGWLNADDVYLPGALRARGRGLRGASRGRVGDRSLPDHRSPWARDPQGRDRV